MLRFLGKEAVFNTSGSLRHQAIICKKELCVHTWPEPKIEPGQFSFPFALTLPTEIPTTFDYRGLVTLKYWVKAVVLSADHKKVVSDHREVQVLNLYRSSVVSVYDNGTFSLRGCLCSRGRVSIGAHMDKDVYYPSETGVLTIEVDNTRSKACITSFAICLTRAITVRVGSGTVERINDSLYRLILNKTIPKQSSLLADQALTIDMPFHRFKEKIERAGSTEATLIRCQYLIEVVAGFDSCVSEKRFAIEVKLYPENYMGGAHPEIPEGWNPSILPAQRFSVDQAWEYQPSAPQIDD